MKAISILELTVPFECILNKTTNTDINKYADV